jgi:hypothetical protein
LADFLSREALSRTGVPFKAVIDEVGSSQPSVKASSTSQDVQHESSSATR